MRELLRRFWKCGYCRLRSIFAQSAVSRIYWGTVLRLQERVTWLNCDFCWMGEALKSGHGKSALLLRHLGDSGNRWGCYGRPVFEDGSILGCRGGNRCPAFFPAVEKFKEFALGGMVPSPTPTRDHGDPQSVGFEAQDKKVGGAGGGT